ncbi:MAG: type II toxin-antitoxin system VapC family toxin [Acidobacteria bacterium]|nr:type II toxin-antitoxin system VapC family toxin [Acidobacteriota bacterium]
MVVDTSAVLAILLAENDALQFARIIERSRCYMTAANYLEAAIVIDQRSTVASYELDLFFRRSAILIEPVTFAIASVARQAYKDFGKGRHKAALNYGDCMAFALSKVRGEPLLYKGDDFRRAGVVNALKP